MAATKDAVPRARRSMRQSMPQVDMFGRRVKKVQYENTFRLEPKVLFPSKKATTIIKEILETRLSDTHYDPDTCMMLCKTLACEIKDSMKELAVSLTIRVLPCTPIVDVILRN